MKTLYPANFCSEHLTHLYQALEKNDVERVYEMEHFLTPEEECIACTYVLHEHGPASDILEKFLENYGLGVISKPLSTSERIKFWIGRIALFGLTFFIIWQGGVVFKSFIFESQKSGAVGTFGWISILIFSLAVYTILESWILE